MEKIKIDRLKDKKSTFQIIGDGLDNAEAWGMNKTFDLLSKIKGDQVVFEPSSEHYDYEDEDEDDDIREEKLIERKKNIAKAIDEIYEIEKINKKENDESGYFDLLAKHIDGPGEEAVLEQFRKAVITFLPEEKGLSSEEMGKIYNKEVLDLVIVEEMHRRR
jgi:hypothetical protein